MKKESAIILSLAVLSAFLLGIVAAPHLSNDREEVFEPESEESELEDEAIAYGKDELSDEAMNAPIHTASETGDCRIFPADNPWNTDISNAPVHANSAAYIRSLGLDTTLHPDFGGEGEYGIPYVVVGDNQPDVAVTFEDYPEESDPGPYPIPPDAPIENADDAHVLVVDKDACKLYELYNARKDGSGWIASNGAAFDLTSNALRPDYWTSADAAGLPIFPGLVRYDEVASGRVSHALRFTAKPTQRAFIHPATHYASPSIDADLPPMGLRVRLKKDFDISGFPTQARVILQAMKTYGLLLADNGGNWFVTGAQDPRWDDEMIETLKEVPGSAFEAVETGPLIRPEAN